MSYNIPTSTDFLTALSDRSNFRYYRLKINGVDLTSKISKFSLSGGQKEDYSQWSVTLLNNDNSITEGDYAEEEVTIEAKVGSSDFYIIFTGFVSETGASKTRGEIGNNKIKLTFYDRQKSKGIKQKPESVILADYKICDPSSTSTSLIHYLAGLTGVTTLDSSEIDYTVPVVEIGSESAWNELKKIADLYKADMYYRYDGAFRFYSPYETTYSTPSAEWTFIASPNEEQSNSQSLVRGAIAKGSNAISANRCKVEFSEYDTYEEQIIFLSTENYDSVTKQCSIEIDPQSYYPGTDSGDYASLQFKDPIKNIDITIATDVQTPTIGTTGSGCDIENTGGTLELISFNGSTTATKQESNAAQIILYNSSVDTICEITKLTIRGVPHIISKSNTVEDIDPTLTYSYQYVDEKLDGKYASTVEQAQSACFRTVEYGKENRKKIKFQSDWCPVLQRGAIINFKEIGEVDQLYKITQFTHKNKGSVFYTEIEAEEFIDTSVVSRTISKGVSLSSDIASKTNEDTEQSINEVEEIVSQVPTMNQLNADSVFTSVGETGTTIPTVPILTLTPLFKGMKLEMDMQENLTNFKCFEIQVSGDNVDWYSLKTDDTDYKDTLDGVTEYSYGRYIHTPIPLAGTEAEPEGQLVYYRVRRKTKVNLTSEWSDIVSATTLTIQGGDIPANSITTNKLETNFLSASIAEVDYSLTIGWNGTGDDSLPEDGDNRIYIDNDEITWNEYTNENWSEANQIRIGGRDENNIPRSFINVRGVANPMADDISQEFFPGGKVANFENTYDTVDGTSPITSPNPAGFLDTGFYTTYSKFGSYSMSYMDNGNGFGYGVVQYPASDIDTTLPYGGSLWFYKPDNGSPPALYPLVYMGFYENAGQQFNIQIQLSGATARLRVVYSYGSATYEKTTSFKNYNYDEWTFIAWGWDPKDAPANSTAWMLVNDQYVELTAFYAPETPSSTDYNIIKLTTNRTSSGFEDPTEAVYIDEFCYLVNEVATPDLFYQHYLHDQPWNTDVSAKDLVLKPADGGKVFIDGGFALDDFVTKDLLIENSAGSAKLTLQSKPDSGSNSIIDIHGWRSTTSNNVGVINIFNDYTSTDTAVGDIELHGDGNVKFSGWVGIATDPDTSSTSYRLNVNGGIKCSSWFRSTGSTGWYNQTYGGGVYMTDTTYVRVYNSKYFTASRVYGAVGNDYADAIEIDEELDVEYGYVYVRTEDGRTRKSNRYAEKGIIGITTNTQSFTAHSYDGEKDRLPVSVAGFVLAHTDKVYKSGTPLTSSKNGRLTKANVFVKLFFPERVIGTFYKDISVDEWNGIDVNNRKIVRVR